MDVWYVRYQKYPAGLRRTVRMSVQQLSPSVDVEVDFRVQKRQDPGIAQHVLRFGCTSCQTARASVLLWGDVSSLVFIVGD